MSTPEHILVETHDGVRTLVFNRPQKKNAFTRAMYEQLVGALDDATNENDVRVLVLCGARGCFTAGNDLEDFMHVPPTGPESAVFQLLLRLSSFEKPIVAAVQGPAIGLGTTMLLHCDIVVAGEGAFFRLPFVDLGLCPEGASSLLLARLVGHAQASELLLLGERFEADRARALGLVNQVCPDESVVARAQELARALARKPPDSVRATKALLRRGVAERVRDTLHAEAEQFLQLLRSPQAGEAFSAFFERRAPDFSRLR